MSFGKMEGDASDKNIAFMLQDDEADGPYYHQEWEGMKQTTPIISGGMNALRLPPSSRTWALQRDPDCRRRLLRTQGWPQAWCHLLPPR